MIQVLPTSPFISTEEIDGFIGKMIEQNYDTLVSIHVRRIGQRKGEPWEKVQPNLSIKYYNDAIEMIRQRISKPHFFNQASV